MALTVLGVTVNGLKEKRKVGFYLEKHLAVNYKGGDVKNGVGRKVEWCEVVVRLHPPKEIGTRGTHAPGYVIEENHNLSLSRSWPGFIACCAPEDVFLFWKLARVCELLERSFGNS